ncbi:MAG: hypothetical protein ACYTGL_08035 [Planctomycetota bacterium]|jgi:hypothetical protein
MDVRRITTCIAIAISLTGCTVTSGSKQCETEDDSVNIGPLIGLIGMAVDGDDKDDYEHFFDDGCKCRKCRH